MGLDPPASHSYGRNFELKFRSNNISSLSNQFVTIMPCVLLFFFFMVGTLDVIMHFIFSLFLWVEVVEH